MRVVTSRLMFLAAAITLAGGCGGNERTITVTAERTVTTEVTVTEGGTAEADAPPIYVLSPGGLRYKPAFIVVGAPDVIREIEWESYGGDHAQGRGEYFPGEIPVTFTLHEIVPCDGVAA